MNDVVYRLKKEQTDKHVTYGMEIIENGVLTQYISNISTQKRNVEKLVRICNKNNVEPIHVPDIIEDMSVEIMRSAERVGV